MEKRVEIEAGTETWGDNSFGLLEKVLRPAAASDAAKVIASGRSKLVEDLLLGNAIVYKLTLRKLFKNLDL